MVHRAAQVDLHAEPLLHRAPEVDLQAEPLLHRQAEVEPHAEPPHQAEARELREEFSLTRLLANIGRNAEGTLVEPQAEPLLQRAADVEPLHAEPLHQHRCSLLW